MLMGISRHIERLFRAILPGPFGLAVLLTLVAAILSLLVEKQSLIDVGLHWQKGFWDPSMMVFTLQMALILILGYSVAVSPPVNNIINRLINLVGNQSQAIVLLTMSSMMLGWINWGLGLLFGAVMARKTAENFQNRNIPFYFPLLGAAGYAGMLTWHSGLSGSAPLKAAEKNHLRELSDYKIAGLPESLPINETILTTQNMISFAVLLILTPLVLLFFRKKNRAEQTLTPYSNDSQDVSKPKGAERFEHTRLPALCLGAGLIAATILSIAYNESTFGPNALNGLFLGFALMVYGSLNHFFQSVKAGMEGAAAILIQFPFYFGVMGILKYGGLIDTFTQWFVSIGTESSMPHLIMVSAGLVNFFVPSGGGQWAVQGPLILSICESINLPISKGIMAMAYGDQLTNMLQPFWALPLLAITGLKAHKVLPYTFLMMLLASFVYGLTLFI
ncbi:MAG: TIGR00366 family protein [Cryomorphaceae bacterium]|nr:TIGR00366 family protein [Cryomorphaceae bacterium]